MRTGEKGIAPASSSSSERSADRSGLDQDPARIRIDPGRLAAGPSVTDPPAVPRIPNSITGADRSLLARTLRQMQRGVGNAAVQRLVRANRKSITDPVARSIEGDLIRPAAPVLMRDGPIAAPTSAPTIQRQVQSKEGILDGVHIKTYRDAAGFLQSHVADLDAERKAVLGDG